MSRYCEVGILCRPEVYVDTCLALTATTISLFYKLLLVKRL